MTTAFIRPTRNTISRASTKAREAGRASWRRSRRDAKIVVGCALRLTCIQAREGAAADVVDARIDDAFALDLDEHRRRQIGAIEFAHGEGEVGALGLPGGEEFRSELDLRRPHRSANRDAPAPPVGRRLQAFGEARAQFLCRLLEGEAP